MRLPAWQTIWKFVHHYLLIEMIYWGGTIITRNGVIYAMHYVSSKHPSDSPLVIVDVGANLGQFSMMYVMIFKQPLSICSFEPSYNTFRSLSKLVKESPFDGMITPINPGISNYPGVMKLYSSESNSSIASV